MFLGVRMGKSKIFISFCDFRLQVYLLLLELFLKRKKVMTGHKSKIIRSKHQLG